MGPVYAPISPGGVGPVCMPISRPDQLPAKSFLAWHEQEVFKGKKRHVST